MKFFASDFTILYIVHIDSIERLENLVLSVNYILRSISCDIHILEVSAYKNDFVKKLLGHKVQYEFIQDNDPILYRTKYLNYMLKRVHTPFVGVVDSDVIIPKSQVEQSILLLRNGTSDFVYPYKRKFMNTTTIIRKMYINRKRVSYLERNKEKMTIMNPPHPVGGAFFCRLSAYRDLGFENEKFYGWGIEDGDRFYRWNSSDYKIAEIDGTIYHLSHPRSENSNYQNQEQQYIKMRYLSSVLNKSTNELYDK